MNSDKLIESLKQEFLCYYHADLIPIDWKNKNMTDNLAQASAGRLLRKVDQRNELVNLIKDLISNRSHPVNEILSRETDIEWCVEDSDWVAYKNLLEEIVKYLEE